MIEMIKPEIKINPDLRVEVGLYNYAHKITSEGVCFVNCVLEMNVLEPLNLQRAFEVPLLDLSVPYDYDVRYYNFPDLDRKFQFGVTSPIYNKDGTPSNNYGFISYHIIYQNLGPPTFGLKLKINDCLYLPKRPGYMFVYQLTYMGIPRKDSSINE